EACSRHGVDYAWARIVRRDRLRPLPHAVSDDGQLLERSAQPEAGQSLLGLAAAQPGTGPGRRHPPGEREGRRVSDRDPVGAGAEDLLPARDRKSTRLNSSHQIISYA